MLVAKELKAPLLARAHSEKNCRWERSLSRTVRSAPDGRGTGRIASCRAPPSTSGPAPPLRLPNSSVWEREWMAAPPPGSAGAVIPADQGGVGSDALADGPTDGRLAQPMVRQARSTARAVRRGARRSFTFRIALGPVYSGAAATHLYSDDRCRVPTERLR